MNYLKTKTNWRKYECFSYDFPRTILNRVKDRIDSEDDGSRVKHISEKIDQDGSWNSLMLDEMARGYSMMNLFYRSVEKGMSRESFVSIYCSDKEVIPPPKQEIGFTDTITNWRQYECIFHEVPLALINRVDDRLNKGDTWSRVKHTSKEIDQDGSWNSLMLDELSMCYALMDSKYEAVEEGISKEDFISIYCKDSNILKTVKE